MIWPRYDSGTYRARYHGRTDRATCGRWAENLRERLGELTGLDLNDPDVHFNLKLAARTWGTLRAL